MACIPLAAQSGGPNKIHFVKKAATGKNNGSNWTDAYRYLQDALAVAQPGDEIWIAQGAYHPDEGEGFTKGDREASFILIPGVKVIGGFSGRRREYISDPDKYASILSGDLNEDDGPFTGEENDAMTENSKFVVRASSYLVCEQGNECSFHLEAVTVQSSYMGSGLSAGGGNPSEMFLTLKNIHVRQNWSRYSGAGTSLGGTTVIMTDTKIYENTSTGENGAGIHTCCDARLFISKSEFRHNNAYTLGGGLHLRDAEAFISSTTFENNSAAYGGGIYTNYASLYVEGSRFLRNKSDLFGGGIAFSRPGVMPHTIINSVFVGNRAESLLGDYTEGGALAAGDAGQYSIINCTFTDNYAGSTAGAITAYWRAEMRILNSIIWNNPATVDNRPIVPLYETPTANIFIANSIVKGGVADPLTDGGGNLDLDPVFADPLGADGIPGTGDEDLRLTHGSPAIDAGEDHFLPPDSTDLDMDGNHQEPFPLDYRGVQRILSGTPGFLKPDMGAFEYSMFSETPTRPSVTIQLYPNPARDDLFIHFSESISGVLKIEVIDLTGRRVITDVRSGVSASESRLVVSISHLFIGMYFIRITGDSVLPKLSDSYRRYRKSGILSEFGTSSR